MEDKYIITCNENQMKMIAVALEQYSRMICGQLETRFLPSIEHALEKETRPDFDDFIVKRKTVDEKLKEIKKIIYKDGMHSGIGYDENSDCAYDMYKCIGHQFEEEKKEQCRLTNKKYSWNVFSELPRNHSKEPLIKIKKYDIRNQKLDNLNKKE